MLNSIIADHTGQSLERVERDTERDYFMGPVEAVEYGLIDEVLRNPKKAGDGNGKP